MPRAFGALLTVDCRVPLLGHYLLSLPSLLHCAAQTLSTMLTLRRPTSSSPLRPTCRTSSSHWRTPQSLSAACLVSPLPLPMLTAPLSSSSFPASRCPVTHSTCSSGEEGYTSLLDPAGTCVHAGRQGGRHACVRAGAAQGRVS